MQQNASESGTSGYHQQFQGPISRLISQVSLQARKKMYDIFEQEFKHPASVLDMGVTSESIAPEANFFEEWFPFKDRITAAGIEDANHLEQKYPGLKFVKIQPTGPLPFKDKQFSVAFSNAVIEHITDPGARIHFLKELMRVAESVCITTPNRYFPIEHHTGVPLIHFLSPSLFSKLLDAGKISKFYTSSVLQPMNKSELESIAKQLNVPYEIKSIQTFGFPSNLILILRKS